MVTGWGGGAVPPLRTDREDAARLGEREAASSARPAVVSAWTDVGQPCGATSGRLILSSPGAADPASPRAGPSLSALVRAASADVGSGVWYSDEPCSISAPHAASPRALAGFPQLSMVGGVLSVRG